MKHCELVGALDVGKTHARFSVVDPGSGAEVWSARRVNHGERTALGWQLDVSGVECWLVDVLRNAPGRERIGAIVPIAHGAAAVLVDEDGNVLAAPDYEDPRFGNKASPAPYEAERDVFARTFSPALPLGLNLGRQLFHLEQEEPAMFAKVARVLLYPQFWAWRLSGVMASEVSSLGCHSDLWVPACDGRPGAFSELARRRGWDSLFPALRFAGDDLGTATGPLARAAGLSLNCRVMCGIHDSNASYLRYLLQRREKPFAVISSGTWTVVMANKARLDRLRAERDMLANVDVFGSAVATARFMGGREYEAIAGTGEAPTVAALESVIRKGAMALPSFAAGGPFAMWKGRLLNADGLEAPERAALATLFMALMSDVLLELLDVDGEVIVDGPLAGNPLFGGILAALQQAHGSNGRILVEDNQSAVSAICFLAGYSKERGEGLKAFGPIHVDVRGYWGKWRGEVGKLKGKS